MVLDIFTNIHVHIQLSNSYKSNQVEDFLENDLMPKNFATISGNFFIFKVQTLFVHETNE